VSKQPIAWHEECLNNQRHSYERRLVELDRLQGEVERFRIAVTIYEQQIAEAKRRGMEGFDRDRFMKSRRDAANSEEKR
jgi:hypothetical protein